jgi:hypothetical protein
LINPLIARPAQEPPRLAPIGQTDFSTKTANRILQMATRRGCALSREPRSLPLLFLKSGKRIFKPQFGGAKFVRRMVANHVLAVQT